MIREVPKIGQDPARTIVSLIIVIIKVTVYVIDLCQRYNFIFFSTVFTLKYKNIYKLQGNIKYNHPKNLT